MGSPESMAENKSVFVGLFHPEISAVIGPYEKKLATGSILQ